MKRIALAIATPPAPVARRSMRVRTAAALLDMDPNDVRALLRTGKLEGHRIGVRGIRIYEDSLAAYQERRPVAATAAPAPTGASKRRPMRAVDRAAYHSALAELENAGVVVQR